MPRRRIGQETFGFEARERSTVLDELHGLIEWGPVEAALAAIPVARRGEAGWPALSLFKALLIAVWHDLSATNSFAPGR
jgi:transposase, IS5 family